jgi:hypothetical protein
VHPAGYREPPRRQPLRRQPLKREPLKRHRLRQKLSWRGGVQRWRSLPAWRRPAAAATAGAKPASKPGTLPGSGAASQQGFSDLSPQHAGTRSPTRATRGVWTSNYSRAGTETEPGGIAAACPLAASSRSPNSSDRNVGKSLHSSYPGHASPQGPAWLRHAYPVRAKRGGPAWTRTRNQTVMSGRL